MQDPTIRRLVTVLLGLFLAPLISSLALGQGVIPGNVIFSQPPAAPPGTYIMQSAYPGDASGLFAIGVTTVAVGQYRFNYYGIAETYSVHAATAGLVFTPAYVAGDTPLLRNDNNPGEFEITLGIGQSVLLAYWDNALYQLNSPQPGAPGNPLPDAYDAYGWFRLTRLAGGLVIADSATAMGGGIVVGTYTGVPEPTVLSLWAAAVAVFCLRRAR